MVAAPVAEGPSLVDMGSEQVHTASQLVSIYFPPHCLPFGRADTWAPCVGVLSYPVTAAAGSPQSMWVYSKFKALFKLVQMGIVWEGNQRMLQ